MIVSSDYKVWIAIEQRLDGLTGRWGPDPYIEVTLEQGKDKPNVRFNVDLVTAKTLARGMTKAVKRAQAV